MAGQSADAHSIAESRSISPTLRSAASGSNSVPRVAYAVPDDAGEPNYIVRKLLPIEAERLQGFPDHWTNVEINGEVMTDKDRHACLGNSMTVDVMRWIGERLDGATRDDRARGVGVAQAAPRSSAYDAAQTERPKLPPARRRLFGGPSASHNQG